MTDDGRHRPRCLAQASLKKAAKEAKEAAPLLPLPQPIAASTARGVLGKVIATHCHSLPLIADC